MFNYIVIIDCKFISYRILIIKECFGQASKEVRIIYTEFLCHWCIVTVQHMPV